MTVFKHSGSPSVKKHQVCDSFSYWMDLICEEEIRKKFVAELFLNAAKLKRACEALTGTARSCEVLLRQTYVV